MRGGRLLAEESPDELLRKYNSESLENVFLKLSIIQNRGKRRRSSILHDVTASISVPVSIWYSWEFLQKIFFFKTGLSEFRILK